MTDANQSEPTKVVTSATLSASPEFWAYFARRAPHYCRYPEGATGAVSCVECGGRGFVQVLDGEALANGETLTIRSRFTF